MKTDHDLMKEAIRWFHASTGAPAAYVERKMLEFDQMWRSFQTPPPMPMSDAEYATKLEQLKREAPAYLHFLLNNDFHETPLPPGFTSKN